MREDGFSIDQIVLSPSAFLTAAPGRAQERRDDPAEAMNAIAFFFFFFFFFLKKKNTRRSATFPI